MEPQEHEEDAELLARLKRVYRGSGIRYRDAAGRLGVSEATVKRVMNGHGLTLAMLRQLCAVADISLFELVSLTEREIASALPVVTLDQARALASDMTLGTVFFLITKHWDSTRIAREFGFDAATMNHHLIRLDQLGVIALFPANRVRQRRRMSKDLRYRLTGLELVGGRVATFLHGLDLSDTSIAWTSGIARLSAASFSRISELLDQLRDTIFELGDADLDLPPEQIKWHLIFAGVRPVDAKELFDRT